MSNIRALFTLLAALPVTYEDYAGNTKTITGLDLTQIRGDITAAELPVRVIEMIGKVSASTDSALVIGGQCPSHEVTWTLTDSMFLRPVGVNGDLQTTSVDLIEYMDAYVSMLPAINTELAENIPTMTLESLGIDPPNVYAYPLLGRSEYFGVVAKLTFKEIK